MATDLGIQRLDSYPTENDKEQANRIADRHCSLLNKSLEVIFSVITVIVTYASFHYHSWDLALPLSIYGAIGSWAAVYYFHPRLSKNLPSTKNRKEIRKDIGIKQRRIYKEIECLEKENDGFLWRIYREVKDYDERFMTEKCARMAEASRGRFVHELKDNQREYCQFIEDAKDVLSRNKVFVRTWQETDLSYLT